MNFGRFDPAQLAELMAWFPDASALRIWGGPDFRFPFTPETFRIDSKIDELDTWSLVAGDGALAAFGQCYLRAGRCHFGRVGVSPRLRGAGLGTRLLCEMAREGLAKFGARELSLFVRRDNEAAHRLYQRLGFREAPYPDPAFMTDSRYMIAASLPPRTEHRTPMLLDDVRRMAMALRATTESPHHHYTSFRVRGRIYATAPVEGGSLHVFVDEEDRDRMVKIDPATYTILGWGKKVVGLRVDLGSANADDVGALLRIAWERKAGKR